MNTNYKNWYIKCLNSVFHILNFDKIYDYENKIPLYSFEQMAILTFDKETLETILLDKNCKIQKIKLNWDLRDEKAVKKNLKKIDSDFETVKTLFGEYMLANWSENDEIEKRKKEAEQLKQKKIKIQETFNTKNFNYYFGDMLENLEDMGLLDEDEEDEEK